MSNPKRKFKIKASPLAPEVPVVPVAPEVPEVPEVPEAPVTQVKKALKIKPALEIPKASYYSKALEAFTIIQEYYEAIDEPIPRSEIQWYIDELKTEKCEDDTFWEECSLTKAFLDATFAGEDVDIAVATASIAKVAIAKKPKESDLGPMPSYGSPEFWAWYRKRKQIRLQNEGAGKAQA